MAFSLHGASWMLHGFLSTVSVLIYVPVLFSLFYWGITVALLRSRRARLSQSEGALPPVAFLRPVKPGLIDAKVKAELLLAAARPGDWVLFAVATDADRRLCLQAIEDAGKKRGRGGIRSEVLLCDSAEWEQGPSCNPKVCKLERLSAFLKEEQGPRHWILTDSEMLADATALERFRREWAGAEAGSSAPHGVALTAGYRFIGAQNIWQHFDSLPTLLHLWPGLAVTEWVARWRTRRGAKQERPMSAAAGRPVPIGLGFALGACIAIRQEHLERVGGWERFRRDLAEDNRLGAALASEKIPTLLSGEVFTLDTDPLSSRDWARHQHRVSFTYRVSNGPGFFGMVFTFGLLWAFLGLLIHPASWSAWGIFLITAGARYFSAILAARALNFPVGEQGFGIGRRLGPGFFRRFALVSASSLLEIFFWVAAWLPLPVWWGGRFHRVSSNGKFSSEDAQFSESPLASGGTFHYQSDT